MSHPAFPAELVLLPVSRRPLTLPEHTVATVMEQPLPTATAPVRRLSGGVSIIIVTLNNLVVTRLCIESLLADATAPEYEVIVVDNGSTDGTADYLAEIARRFAHVRIILNDANKGFAPANNQALKIACGNKLVLLNNDTIVSPRWLERLARHLDDPSIGLVGPVTNRIGNEAEIEAGYRTYGEFLAFAESHAAQHEGKCFDIRMLCMFCLGMRREVFERLGPLDEQFETGLLEDDDYSMRAHAAGFRVVCAEDVFVHHFGQASFGNLVATGEYGRILEANRRRFEEKWGVPWQPYGRRQSEEYLGLPGRIQERLRELTPPGATVLIVSKGDAELLKIEDRTGWHFPQNDHGEYAGFYPADSHAAISHLEELRAEGAGCIVFPASGFWWLDYYVDFREHLDRQHEKLLQDQCCVVYRLREPRPAPGAPLPPPSGSVQPQPASHRVPPPASHLRFALEYPETLPLSPPTTPFDPRRMTLHWVLPDFAVGGGGPMAIFRFIRFLERFGHESTIWIRGGTQHGTADEARRVIREHFLPIEAPVKILREGAGDICGDAVIATHCWTAYPVRAVTAVRERFYFVQDFEPFFFPMGSDYLLAEATYRFGFSCITSSKWLQEIMRSRYQGRAARFTYAYDPATYNDDHRQRAADRIAFYARASTPRRAVELGLLALEMLAQRRQSIVVDFFGAKMGRMNVPYQYVDHGVLNDSQLAGLYRDATIGMVFSTTNYSLIPHEMMACGLPVVDLMTESASSEFPLDAITLCEPTPEGIARGVERLLTDDALRERQRERATDYVKQLSWEKSARQIEQALIDGIEARCAPIATPITRATEIEIPVFHGPVIFAGQPEYYRSVHYDVTSTGEHFEFPFTSADPSALRELPRFAKETGARTCIIFRPEWLSPYPEAFSELKAMGVAVIGYSTEPVPQSWAAAYSDQIRRLETLKKALRLNYDLLIHFDGASLEFLSGLGFGRVIAHPLPVSSRLFFPEDRVRDFDVCFLGKSTPHRERMLAPLKMRFDVIHVAHGLRDEEARALMNRSKLVLNLHNDAYPNFENRVIQALFCARPVVSEPLTGDTLVAGRDYIPADSPETLCRVVGELLKAPEAQPPTIDLGRFTIEALLHRLGIAVRG